MIYCLRPVYFIIMCSIVLILENTLKVTTPMRLHHLLMHMSLKRGNNILKNKNNKIFGHYGTCRIFS